MTDTLLSSAENITVEELVHRLGQKDMTPEKDGYIVQRKHYQRQKEKELLARFKAGGGLRYAE